MTYVHTYVPGTREKKRFPHRTRWLTSDTTVERCSKSKQRRREVGRGDQRALHTQYMKHEGHVMRGLCLLLGIVWTLNCNLTFRTGSSAISTVLDLILIDHLDFSSWETIPPSWLTVKPRNSLAVDETVAQWSSIASTNQRDKDNWVVNSTIHRVYRMEESGCTVQFCHWEYRC